MKNALWIVCRVWIFIAVQGLNGVASASQLWWGVRTPMMPRFLESQQNITSVVGETTFLPCNVRYLGDRSITWMRQRDLHILTVDTFTYSSDKRYRVVHAENTDEWSLRIEPVVLRDQGMYECQVNSDPKISRKVFLKINENSQLDDPAIFHPNSSDDSPDVFIEGLKERHIQSGSILSLTCVVRHRPRGAPQDIFWSRGKERLDYDSNRRGVFIKVETKDRRSLSKLSISNITSDDTGDYICNPTGRTPTAVTVHVQNGQYQAAVHQGGLTASSTRSSSTYFLLVSILHFFVLNGG